MGNFGCAGLGERSFGVKDAAWGGEAWEGA